ncbi:MAG TPA: sugar ABC transporter permease [Candidatus Hungatella pullicola]|nr:sugar ABC transporter permease [Candidatus Hungatella pullicola]
MGKSIGVGSGLSTSKKKWDQRQLWAIGFCLPNAVFFLVFFVVPAIVGIWYSLTNYNGLKRMDFVGLDNYIRLFQDPEFYRVLWQTVKYTVCSVPLGYVVSLGFGILLSSESIKGISILRICIYWPILLSTIMVGLTWRWIFGENFGLINYLLTAAGLPTIGWASDPTAAFITTVIAGTWSGCGTHMMIFIGGLKQIPEDLKEAAKLDGANKWQIFRNITLPCLKPLSFMVIILSVINSFKVFAMVQTLTNGGPGTATTYMIQYIYRTGFQKAQVGYASAASMVLFVILMVLSIVQTKVSSRSQED